MEKKQAKMELVSTSARVGRITLLAVNRVSDRLMSMQLVIRKGRLSVISAYAPQVGCTHQEKDLFWEELDEMLQQIPYTEHVIIAGDLNGHIGANGEGFERWHGVNGYGQLNEEGRVILLCAQMFDHAICNTLCNKDEHLITYSSGNTASVIDTLYRVRSFHSINNNTLVDRNIA